MSTENVGNDNQHEDSVSDTSKQVSYESYQKVLNQRKADQAKVKELTQQMQALMQERESANTTALEEQKKFKDLWEQERKKNASLSEQFNGLQNSITESKKKAALAKELGPVKREEYLKFADLNSIVIDESGEVDMDSVRDVAAKFKKDYADLVSASPAKGLPSAAPKASTATTKVDFSKMSMDELIRYNSELNGKINER
jgi:uncharacterized protein YdbL (DUF1318 family)